MRQRITYIRDHDDNFHPDQLAVTKSSMSVQNLSAAKEHRFTIGFSELPRELAAVLEQCHELHVRWASKRPWTAKAPFVSRVAPGLHVFYTPEKEGQGELLCPMLKTIFDDGIKCTTPEETFSKPSLLSTRFASSASFQYHTLLPSLSNLTRYLESHIPPSSSSSTTPPTISALLSADYLDIDYDAISHALLVTVFWEKGPEGRAWDETIHNVGGDRLEVGVLNQEKADEKEEVGLGGWLTVVGETGKPSQTLFSFPSRHHPLSIDTSSTFTTTFDHPTGLHPNLRIHIPVPAGSQKTNPETLTPPSPSCALHAYLTLPSALFLDRHAFTDPLFLASHNLRSLLTLTGATDLEAPDWAVPQWGSAALFELSPSISAKTSGGEEYTATIPLHTRYLSPSRSGSTVNVTAPYPHLFWACMVAEGAPGSAKMSVNPFDRVNLGYDGLFGDRTLFHQFTPVGAGSGTGTGAALTVSLEVPTLDLRQTAWVESGTVAAVVLGVCWVLWKLLGPLGDGGVAKAKREGAAVERGKKAE